MRKFLSCVLGKLVGKMVHVLTFQFKFLFCLGLLNLIRMGHTGDSVLMPFMSG